MVTKIKYVCKKCGSDDLRYDAWAEWCIEKQEMILSATFDYCWCERCQGEAKVIEKKINSDLE